MAKKERNKIFVPFSHENLELKNELIQYARKYSNDQKLEAILSSAFIYASLAEYLANSLLINLRYFAYQGNYVQYAGILFIDERDDDRDRTLGNVVQELKKYNFPDREGILNVLQKILVARNNIFHNLAKADQEGLKKMLKVDITIIQTQTEDLITKINVVYNGLQKILTPQATEENVKNQNEDKRKE